jgi:hypothetical protein
MKTPLLWLALASLCATPAMAQSAWTCTVRGKLLVPPTVTQAAATAAASAISPKTPQTPKPSTAATVAAAVTGMTNFTATAPTQQLAFFNAAHACNRSPPPNRTVPGACVPVACVPVA